MAPTLPQHTSLKASPGAASLTLNNFGGNPYFFDPNFKPLYIVAPGCGTCTDAAHTLNSGFGTTWIDSRTVYIAPGVDFSTPSPIPALSNWRAISARMQTQPSGVCRYAGE